jgi:hypothetical protein
MPSQIRALLLMGSSSGMSAETHNKYTLTYAYILREKPDNLREKPDIFKNRTYRAKNRTSLKVGHL